VRPGSFPAFSFVGRYFVDGLTGEYLELDLDPEFATHLGYTEAHGRKITDHEWEGAQDPAWREREKLDKRLGDFVIPKKRPG
tara:strand:+ start:527 stop:772 length:246 start_codon:yes stop_codon:yes gene_type:complete